MGRDVAAFAAAGLVLQGGHARASSAAAPGHRAGDADRRIILLRAADVIRNVARGGHVIQLRGRIRLSGPCLAAVDGHVRAAIVRFDHALGIVRGDPEVVIIAVRRADDLERFPGVGGLEERRVQHVDRILLLGIGVDARIVERALPQAPVFIDAIPCRARVVGAEQAAVLGFDHRVDAIRVGRHRHADLADNAIRQPRLARDLRPGIAAVRRFIEAAQRSAAR